MQRCQRTADRPHAYQTRSLSSKYCTRLFRHLIFSGTSSHPSIPSPALLLHALAMCMHPKVTPNDAPIHHITHLTSPPLLPQVHADFEYIGQAAGIQTLCVYGGTPYDSQTHMLNKGVDVVVGTPGRVKDHLERKTLKLGQLKFRVLDECDEMLNMGFVSAPAAAQCCTRLRSGSHT